MKRKILIFTSISAVIILFYSCLVCLPYRRRPQVSEQIRKSFSLSSFYGDKICQDRAAVLSDNGSALAERLRLISHAREKIILSTFDFQSDNSGRIMISALLEAARRGVSVQILVDGFSYFAHMQGDPYFNVLASHENVTLKVYNPVNPLRPGQLMARMHDKYLIGDDQLCIIGGRNTYDYFLGDDTDYKNYDWDFLIYNTGEISSSAISQIETYFQEIWQLNLCRIRMDAPGNTQKSASCRKELSEIYSSAQKQHPDWFTDIDYRQVTVETNRIQLLSNPINAGIKEPVLLYTMTELMKQSGEEIVFHTPYILCDSYMLERLSEICRQNASVKMMTNSPANNGNPFGAADYTLHKKELLETGVNILEYDAGVSYHGKCFTIGNRISAVGSFNWDMRSAYLDTELMLVVDSEPLNLLLRREMLRYEADALIVIDNDTYDLHPGQTPQTISSQRRRRIALIRPFDRWFRHLM